MGMPSSPWFWLVLVFLMSSVTCCLGWRHDLVEERRGSCCWNCWVYSWVGLKAGNPYVASGDTDTAGRRLYPLLPVLRGEVADVCGAGGELPRWSFTAAFAVSRRNAAKNLLWLLQFYLLELATMLFQVLVFHVLLWNLVAIERKRLLPPKWEASWRVRAPVVVQASSWQLFSAFF